jgi:hypothetical protein
MNDIWAMKNTLKLAMLVAACLSPSAYAEAEIVNQCKCTSKHSACTQVPLTRGTDTVELSMLRTYDPLTITQRDDWLSRGQLTLPLARDSSNNDLSISRKNDFLTRSDSPDLLSAHRTPDYLTRGVSYNDLTRGSHGDDLVRSRSNDDLSFRRNNDALSRGRDTEELSRCN